jgi:hypothetical protein
VWHLTIPPDEFGPFLCSVLISFCGLFAIFFGLRRAEHSQVRVFLLYLFIFLLQYIVFGLLFNSRFLCLVTLTHHVPNPISIGSAEVKADK